MAFKTLNVAFLGAVLVLGGCSYVNDTFWPSLSGDDETESMDNSDIPVAPGQAAVDQGGAPTGVPVYVPPPPAAPQGYAPPPPALGGTNFSVGPATPGQPTGTFVGGKIVQLRNDLGNLQGAINVHNNELQSIRGQTAQHTQTYYGLVAAIQSRLQVGTTPGNPILTQQWNESQVQIELLGNDIAHMNSLSNRSTADAAMVGFLLESTQAAFGLSGAIEEDHRQLTILEDDVNKTIVVIERLLSELSEDIKRQTEYVARARNNLTTLSLAVKNGEFFGTSFGTRIAQATAAENAVTSAALDDIAFSPTNKRPLVVIRFDRKNVDYQQALYTAVNRAISRQPNAVFDLVAVTPSGGSAARLSMNSNSARRSAEEVLRALSDMGLPAERVRLSAMSSGEASTNEVRIYLR